MNLSRGFVLLELCVSIIISLVIVLLVLSVKKIEVRNAESIQDYIVQEDEKFKQIFNDRNECEVICEEEEVYPLNY